MEKIKLNDNTILEIQSGSTEFEISMISDSVDNMVANFTDSNLERYEILTESDEVCAIYTKKHLKNFKAELVDDGFLITVNLVDRDEVYERLAYLEQMVSELTSESTEEETTEIVSEEEPAE